MNKDDRIFVAGHNGLVGSALLALLESRGYSNLLVRSRAELDLADSERVNAFFDRERPEYVLLAAARVGGILANSRYQGDFLRENLLIQTSVIDAACRNGVQKLLFLGSSCIYPRLAPQPIKEEHLMTGPLEATNAGYAVAKIAGIAMCQAYRDQFGFNAIAAMPTNLFGPGDNFDEADSHVIPGLIAKFHRAKTSDAAVVKAWGTGSPLREFMFSEDLADALLFLMEHYDDADIINVGSGQEVSIKELAETIKDVVGFAGEVEWDSAQPDGTPRKRLDTSRLSALGWESKTPLRQGLETTYQWFLDHAA